MERHSLLTLLRYKRPEGSVTQEYFCQKFLEPVFGDPDQFGNYILVIPEKDGLYPKVCFTAHHDTVHKTDGIQNIFTKDNHAYSEGDECLGADCTTGVWLILEMVAEKIPGVYVIHAAEEVGCIGSSRLVASQPDWLHDLGAVISFDRYGTNSIITHQIGYRTASETFSKSLAGILGMSFKSDPDGTYTDSNEYAEIVSECTNISVGYYGQHTKGEHQDILFAYKLRDALLAADWSQLVFARDPSVQERRSWGNCWSSYYSEDFDRPGDPYTNHHAEVCYEVEDVVRDFPELIAEMLVDWGFDRNKLLNTLEEYGYDDVDFINRKVI